MFYLMKHSTNFIYRHLVKDHSEWEETRCRHIGYSFQLAARDLLYAPSNRQDSTYHGLCYTSCGTLAGMRTSSIGPPWRIDPMTHRTMSKYSYNGATSCSSPMWYLLYFRLSIYLSAYLLYLSFSLSLSISRSSQCSMTGVTKTVVCIILPMEWCI